jgi:AcrR family transcriptional regulator
MELAHVNNQLRRSVAYSTGGKEMSSKEEKLDPRVVRTRKLMRQAVVDLIPEKGFGAITVQDITDRATLNRATFYLHYRDKNDLLMDVFNNMISSAVPDPPEKGAEDVPMSLPIMAVLTHVAQHADFYRAILGEEGVPLFMVRVRSYIEEIVFKWLAFARTSNEQHLVEPEIAINYLGSAYLGVIAWWLNEDMPMSIEDLAAQLARLTALGIHQSLGWKLPPSIEALKPTERQVG